MPLTCLDAIHFLETQWSSINENKIKGILAELAFKKFLLSNNIHFVTGGWLLSPGNNSLIPVPPQMKICILPKSHSFSWQNGTSTSTTAGLVAEIAAYNYFRQVGVETFFASPTSVNESSFTLPQPSSKGKRAVYPKPYHLDFYEIAPSGKLEPPQHSPFSLFPIRRGNMGMRCYSIGRLDAAVYPWTNVDLVADLFWFEYARYFIQVDYLVSNNDLDLFVIGKSGSCYPVEMKSKLPAHDRAIGDWFGIDIGPFAKLSFFTSNSMNTDALYIVEEVDASRAHVEWYGIRFTELVRSCSWVGQSGGPGMTGGKSSTYRIPKAAFARLNNLLQTI